MVKIELPTEKRQAISSIMAGCIRRSRAIFFRSWIFWISGYGWRALTESIRNAVNSFAALRNASGSPIRSPTIRYAASATHASRSA
jgi:hypothetical protein